MAVSKELNLKVALPTPPHHQQPPLSNIEYLTLSESTSLLAGGVSQYPLKVAQKCFEKRLISEHQIRSVQQQGKDDYQKASELVTSVTTKVQDFPEKFHVFMRILHEFPSLGDVVREVNEKYEGKKKNAFDTHDAHDSKLEKRTINQFYYNLFLI